MDNIISFDEPIEAGDLMVADFNEAQMNKVNGLQIFKKCCFNQLVLKTDHFVYVSEPHNPNSKEHAYLAKIFCFYKNAIGEYKALIQMLIRPRYIEKIIQRQNLDISQDHELIIDMRKDITAITIDRIFAKFNVLFCNESQCPSEQLSTIICSMDKFACRFKIIKAKASGKYELVPWKTPTPSSNPTVIDEPNNKENAPYLDNRSERSPVKRKSVVTPIKIVLNKSIRVSPRSQSDNYASSPITSSSDDDDSDDAFTPTKKSRRHHQHNTSFKVKACRNLNNSLNNELNYSIEQQDELKMKIRVSDGQRRKSTAAAVSVATIPNVDCAQDMEEIPAKRTRSKSLFIADSDQNIATPIKVALRNHPLLRTPKSNRATPCKSIMKTPKIQNSTDTPKRSVILSDIVEEQLIDGRTRRVTRHATSNSFTPHTTPVKLKPVDQEQSEYTPKRSTSSRRVSISVKTPSTPKRTPSKRQSSITASSTPKVTTNTKISTPRSVSTRLASMALDTPTSTSRSASKMQIPTTPTRKSATKAKASEPTTPKNVLRKIRDGTLTPKIQSRDQELNRRRSNIQLIKESLHVSAVPTTLPCRENEFKNIYNFIESKILEECGGCMYVSGVPGTGKTATVTEVIRSLQKQVKAKKLPDFEFVEINGMKMTEPRQAYVHIYRQLTGKTIGWEQAHSLLEKRFTGAAGAQQRQTTVILVDELDILCTRRQDVVYNLLDWPTKMAARLVVVTIANTMDLPERLLMGKVTSRLGLTRLTFQPYSFKQLQEVVMARLVGTNMFKSEAVQLVARKVASVSGDCRRALDICRRSFEIAENSVADSELNILVAMNHVEKAFAEMISSSKVRAIKGCSKMEQHFLEAVLAEVTRTGVEETTFLGVYTQFDSILILAGLPVPPPGSAMLLCVRLGMSKLIICESARNDLYQKILLNVNADDIHYALHAKI